MKWAVILAGGNGSRLQSLTRALMGDDRPKQFCPLFAGKTLLAQTRARLGRSVGRSHTLCVVTRGHESYYGPELVDLPPAHVVEQPGNRGTAAAIAYSIMRIRPEDRKAVIGFYPADHYYEDTEAFTRALDATYLVAAAHPDTVFLLGTEPQSPEVEYGWIEPGPSLDMPGTRAFAVRKFWEKPSRAKAADLFSHGCLWNIFVMIGTIGAFRTLLRTALPEVMFAFDLARYAPDSPEHAIDRVYSALTPCDFSRDVLAHHPEKVAVVQLPNIGWIDLGQPARVQNFLGAQRAQTRAFAS
jgi:mannose-1-phosphate guanylyltransferase